jgi:alanine racemase
VAGRPRAEVVVDLDAVRHNVRRLAEVCAPADLMVVVKADGYGHGMLDVAAAAREAGAPWLGVATLDEAMALREAGDTGRVLCWLAVPGEDYAPAVGAGVDVTAYTLRELEEVVEAAERAGRIARLQIKVDTGLSRGGAVRLAEEHGLTPAHLHLANSAAALVRPSSRFGLVRCGLAAYGLSPVPQLQTAADLGLVPAMTARARVAMVKRVPEGSGVSYGHTYVTPRETTLALVPVGYGDGVPRHASSTAPVQVAGTTRRVSGRVCMDQLVVDVDDDVVSPGDEVVLFGPGLTGEPTAQDWADACGTISYEIVTRIDGRFQRTVVGRSPRTPTQEEPGVDR